MKKSTNKGKSWKCRWTKPRTRTQHTHKTTEPDRRGEPLRNTAPLKPLNYPNLTLSPPKQSLFDPAATDHPLATETASKRSVERACSSWSINTNPWVTKVSRGLIFDGGVRLSKEIPRCKANPTQTVWMNLPFCYTLPPVACVRKRGGGAKTGMQERTNARDRERLERAEERGKRRRRRRRWRRRQGGGKKERKKETHGKLRAGWKGEGGGEREWVEGERRNMWFYL